LQAPQGLVEGAAAEEWWESVRSMPAETCSVVVVEVGN